MKKRHYSNEFKLEASLVYKPEDYVNSSAIDYSGEQGLLENVVIFRYFD